jgi:hypothetical protein
MFRTSRHGQSGEPVGDAGPSDAGDDQLDDLPF